MTSTRYVLASDGRTPIPADLLGWIKGMDAGQSTVASTDLPHCVKVTTVFLGVDHNTHPGAEPLLFETRILGLPVEYEFEEYRKLYATHAEALRGHQTAVNFARCFAYPKGYGFYVFLSKLYNPVRRAMFG